MPPFLATKTLNFRNARFPVCGVTRWQATPIIRGRNENNHVHCGSSPRTLNHAYYMFPGAEYPKSSATLPSASGFVQRPASQTTKAKCVFDFPLGSYNKK